MSRIFMGGENNLMYPTQRCDYSRCDVKVRLAQPAPYPQVASILTHWRNENTEEKAAEAERWRLLETAPVPDGWVEIRYIDKEYTRESRREFLCSWDHVRLHAMNKHKEWVKRQRGDD